MLKIQALCLRWAAHSGAIRHDDKADKERMMEESPWREANFYFIRLNLCSEYTVYVCFINLHRKDFLDIRRVLCDHDGARQTSLTGCPSGIISKARTKTVKFSWRCHRNSTDMMNSCLKVRIIPSDQLHWWVVAQCTLKLRNIKNFQWYAILHYPQHK